MMPKQQDDELDRALELTFPASDPIAVGAATGSEVPRRSQRAAHERPPYEVGAAGRETRQVQPFYGESTAGLGTRPTTADWDPYVAMAQPWLFGMRRGLAAMRLGSRMAQASAPHLALAQVLRFACESLADLRETYERMTVRW